jgi:hypothetical protein
MSLRKKFLGILPEPQLPEGMEAPEGMMTEAEVQTLLEYYGIDLDDEDEDDDGDQNDDGDEEE